jgi:hypothetical protein
LGRLGCALGYCIPKEVADWKNSYYVPGYSIPKREIQLERLGYALSYCISVSPKSCRLSKRISTSLDTVFPIRVTVGQSRLHHWLLYS